VARRSAYVLGMVSVLVLAWGLGQCAWKQDNPPAGERPGRPVATYTPTSPSVPEDAPPVSGSPPGPGARSAQPSVDQRLAQAAHLHRYGYYTQEQALLQALAQDPQASPTQRLLARYRLAESYLADERPAEALSMLDRFLADGAGLAEEDDRRVRALFLRGEALAALGRPSQAVAAYRAFLEHRPELGEVVEPIIGQVWQEAGDLERAAQAFQRAAELAVDRVDQVRHLETVAGIREAQGRWADAAQVYEAILERSRRPGYRTRIHYRAGMAWDGAGEAERAIAHWQAALDQRPEEPAAYRALVELVRRNVAVDEFLRGYIDLQAEAYAPAVRAYERFLALAPLEDPRRGEAWLGLARAHMGMGHWAPAESALVRVLEAYRSCACYGEAWLERARLAILRGDSVQGRRLYRTFAREHPADPLAPEALWRSVLSALAEDAYPELAADVWALADSFPASRQAGDALSVLGMSALVNRRYEDAAAAFARRRGSASGTSWEAATYWLGRAQAALGRRAEARATWEELVARAPESYYGVLAAVALRRGGADPGQAIFAAAAAIQAPPTTLPGDDGSPERAQAWLATWLPAPPQGWDPLPPAVARDPDLRNGELLLDLGRRSEALRLLERTYRRYRDDPVALYGLARHFQALETYSLSIRATAALLDQSPARRIQDAPLFLQRLLYPRYFAELIEPAAQEYDIDPLLLYSLVRQESLFEEGARSSAAAQGLMQIIPDTGRWIAERLGHPTYRNALIYRPHLNVRFGSYYLAWVREYTDGRWVSALVGYNAGPGNVRAWRERYGNDDTLFVELLPIGEPRTYIQRILVHYYHYRRLWAASG